MAKGRLGLYRRRPGAKGEGEQGKVAMKKGGDDGRVELGLGEGAAVAGAGNDHDHDHDTAEEQSKAETRASSARKTKTDKAKRTSTWMNDDPLPPPLGRDEEAATAVTTTWGPEDDSPSKGKKLKLKEDSSALGDLQSLSQGLEAAGKSVSVPQDAKDTDDSKTTLKNPWSFPEGAFPCVRYLSCRESLIRFLLLWWGEQISSNDSQRSPNATSTRVRKKRERTSRSSSLKTDPVFTVHNHHATSNVRRLLNTVVSFCALTCPYVSSSKHFDVRFQCAHAHRPGPCDVCATSHGPEEASLLSFAVPKGCCRDSRFPLVCPYLRLRLRHSHKRSFWSSRHHEALGY
jgi:hypothetical protein